MSPSFRSRAAGEIEAGAVCFFEEAGELRIKKVINNNILCVVDDRGGEMIVTGKGLGFQRKIGERVDPSLFEKTYHMEGKAEQRKLRELCRQIPIEHLRLTQDLIEHIKTQVSALLNESLLITLADHISFAIKRKENGVEFTNPLEGAVMSYYPAEYRLGQHCLRVIREETRADLNPSEASFIAPHIVNAELKVVLKKGCPFGVSPFSFLPPFVQGLPSLIHLTWKAWK